MSKAYSIIKTVLVSEKVAELMENENKYVFKVCTTANKIEIAKAVEELFSVKVEAVNTINYAGKRKRLRGMKMGKRADWKKAIVTLAEGNSIDIY
ncbi:MAG: 50S ribosomal protein L23 [Lentisphaeria bacterium]